MLSNWSSPLWMYWLRCGLIATRTALSEGYVVAGATPLHYVNCAHGEVSESISKLLLQHEAKVGVYNALVHILQLNEDG